MEFNARERLRERLALEPLAAEDAYSYFLHIQQEEAKKSWSSLYREANQANLEKARRAGVLTHPALGSLAAFYKEQGYSFSMVTQLLERVTNLRNKGKDWLIPHYCRAQMGDNALSYDEKDSLTGEQYFQRLLTGLMESYFAFSRGPKSTQENSIQAFEKIFATPVLSGTFFSDDFFTRVNFFADALESFQDNLILLALVEEVSSQPHLFQEKPEAFPAFLNLILGGPTGAYSKEPPSRTQRDYVRQVFSLAVLYQSLESLGPAGALSLSDEVLKHPEEVGLEELLVYLENTGAYEAMPLSWWLPLVREDACYLL